MKRCNNCGYMNNNFFDGAEECPLCNTKLIEENISNKQDDSYHCQCANPNFTEDDYCFRCNKFKKKNTLSEENEANLKDLDTIDNEIFETMSILYAREMRETSPDRVWDNIMKNKDIDKLIFNIEWYLEALFKFEKEFT